MQLRLPRGPLAAAAEGLGDGIDAVLRGRHRRRLVANGWVSSEDGLAGLLAPRTRMLPGNSVDVLIDGRDAFASMLDALRAARHTISITGWTASADFRLVRGAEAVTLGQALGEAAGRGVGVRVLLWGGPPLPVGHPTRADAQRSKAGFDAVPGVRCLLDRREYPMDCHHEKLLIVDDRVAFAGGLDFSDFAYDRWDTGLHAPHDGSVGWHDVAIRVEGPAASAAARHVEQRWAEMAGVQGVRAPSGVQEHAALPEGAGEQRKPRNPLAPSDSVRRVADTSAVGSIEVGFARTIPDGVYRFLPRGDFSILSEYVSALSRARRLVYLENQFLWCPEVVDVLEGLLRRRPDDFRLLLVLPSRPHAGVDATLGQLSRLVDADAGRGRLLATILQHTAPGHHVYVHAKVGIVDDEWLTVGSANLNEHSLFNDTEANFVVRDSRLAADTRRRLWAEHLGRDCGGDPLELIDQVWRRVADEQTQRHRAGQAPTARIRTIDHIGPRTDLLLGPLTSVVVDG